MSTTLVRAASTRVRCAPMRGSVPPSWRQPAAIEFEKLPSSGIYFLGAGEDRPFETCFCEVIVMSFCTDKGEGDSEMSGRKPEKKRREVNAVPSPLTQVRSDAMPYANRLLYAPAIPVRVRGVQAVVQANPCSLSAVAEELTLPSREL